MEATSTLIPGSNNGWVHRQAGRALGSTARWERGKSRGLVGRKEVVRQDQRPSHPIQYFPRWKSFPKLRGSERMGSPKGKEAKWSESVVWCWGSSFSCHSVGAELCGPADLSTRPCDFCLGGILDFSEQVSHLSKICRWICVCVNLCVRWRISPPVTRRCILRNLLPQVLSAAIFLPDHTVIHRWLMINTLCNSYWI